MSEAAKKLKAALRKANSKKLERMFLFNLQGSGLNLFVPEHKFCRDVVGDGPGIRARLKAAKLSDWRFDFADIENKIAVELEGGIWIQGRHTRGAGFMEDAKKYNRANILGWTVMRYTHFEIRTSQAVHELVELYQARDKEGLLKVTPHLLA
jgi:very-short-patch-repair endonuclease